MIEVELATHASSLMWVKPAGASSYGTKNIPNTSKTIIHPPHTPYIYSRTDMNTDP
jgi:hypothetical protein